MTSALPNPNWPPLSVELDGTTGPPDPLGLTRLSLLAPSRQMSVVEIDIRRGRQYELNQFEAGTASLSVIDPLEMLNAANHASPFNTNGNQIDSYRAIGIYAYWPIAGNLYNPGVRGGADASFEIGTGGFGAGGGTVLDTSTAQAWIGSRSMSVTQGSATSAAWPTLLVSTVPGMAHTISVQVYLTPGSVVRIQVPDQNIGLATSAAAIMPGVWQRLTLTFTAVDCLTTITIAGTGSSKPAYFLDAMQYEFGNRATPFVTTGPTRYPLFVGYVEQWPLDWDKGGTRGVRRIECVDALSILARTEISQSYDAAIAADSPQLLIPFHDTALPGTVIGAGGFLATPAPSASGNFNWGGDKTPDGAPALVASQQNPHKPPSAGGDGQNTEWNTTQGSLSLDTTAATIECWAKVTAGVVSFMQVAVVGDGVTVLPDQQHAHITTSAGRVVFSVSDPTTNSSLVVGAVSPDFNGFPDGQWHYYAITFFASGGVALTIDGRETDFSITPVAPRWGINNLHLDALTGFGDPLSQLSVARFAIYPRDIGFSARQAHYLRGIGYNAELSGDRVGRLLSTFWDPTGRFTTAPGVLQLAPDFNYDTRMVLDVIQEITASEAGQFYADRFGRLQWEDRSSRYASQHALAVFGEHANSGEIPYTTIQFGFDPTYVYSQATLTRPGSNTTVVWPNPPPSTPRYGQRILSQTIQATNDFDLQQAGIFYSQRYSKPQLRIKALSVEPSSLDPAECPTAWPALLGAELSQRHTVTRRASQLTMTGDQYIESVSHKINANSRTWTVDFEMSPVFNPQAWILGDPVAGVLGTTTIPIY